MTTTNFDRIIASIPINRSTAIVASGPNIDAPITPQQRRENLVGLSAQIERAIMATTDKRRKKELGERKFEVQEEISKINKVIRPNRRDLTNFIVEVVKERMTKAQFGLVLNEAERRHDAYKNAGES